MNPALFSHSRSFLLLFIGTVFNAGGGLFTYVLGCFQVFSTKSNIKLSFSVCHLAVMCISSGVIIWEWYVIWVVICVVMI
jgi:hypothetical protein